LDSHPLQKIGLGKGESKVYLTLIDIGPAAIGAVSKRAGITPAKVYIIIEKLKQKGLVTETIQSGTKHFQSQDPEQLLSYIKEKEKLLAKEKEDIKELIPKLKAKQKSRSEQSIQIYDDIKGIETLLAYITDSCKEKDQKILHLTYGDEYADEILREIFLNFYNKLSKQGARVSILAADKSKSTIHQQSKQKLTIQGSTQIRFCDINAPTSFIIYDDKAAILQYKDHLCAFEIKSEPTIQSYKRFFEQNWKQARE
jgi:sugar-specific transcriptional regulator TrmB